MDFNNIPLVAVALSIVICWSLFAMFCSFVHEAIAQIKAERGRFMKKCLFRQFYDQPNGVNWASILYMHGSVDLLTRAVNKPTSEIDARLFAETLIEVVGKAHITQMHKKDVSDQLRYKSETLNDFKAATLSLQQSDVVNFFQQSLRSAELFTKQDGSPDDAAIYNHLVDQVEKWYSGMMDRLSLWYRKKTKLRLFLLGSLLAAILNIDSIQLFQHFVEQPASRKVMMDYYEANAERLNKLAAASPPDEAANYKEQVQSLANEMDLLAKEAALPIGWQYHVFNPDSVDKRNMLLALVGFLISGFAASAGAPFWFDVLKKAYSAKTKKS